MGLSLSEGEAIRGGRAQPIKAAGCHSAEYPLSNDAASSSPSCTLLSEGT
jgi:hypothetical protein